MDVLLKQDVEKLGFKDEMVTVKSGYARNYLIPQGMAIQATPSVKKMHEETLRQRAHKEAKLVEEANKMAEKLQNETIKIGAKVGENGKIFGSVNTIQLADALNAAGYKVDRKFISIKGDAIKAIGKYEATAMLYKDVKTNFEFEVVED